MILILKTSGRYSDFKIAFVNWTVYYWRCLRRSSPRSLEFSSGLRGTLTIPTRRNLLLAAFLAATTDHIFAADLVFLLFDSKPPSPPSTWTLSHCARLHQSSPAPPSSRPDSCCRSSPPIPRAARRHHPQSIPGFVEQHQLKGRRKAGSNLQPDPWSNLKSYWV